MPRINNLVLCKLCKWAHLLSFLPRTISAFFSRVCWLLLDGGSFGMVHRLLLSFHFRFCWTFSTFSGPWLVKRGLHTLRKRQLQGGHLGAWQSPLHVGAQVDPVGKPSRVLASWPWPLPTVHWWKLLLLSQRKAGGGVKVKGFRGGLGKESKEEDNDCLYWLKDLENSVHLTAKKDQNDTPHSYIQPIECMVSRANLDL